MSTAVLTRHRGWVVLGAIAIQLALGAIYAWSVFTPALTDPQGAYGFTASQAAWVFSAGLATFAVVMVLAGRALPSVGPRRLAVASGCLLGVGYLLGGLLGDRFELQLLAIGVIGGAGIGLGYVVPIAVGIKWFPDHKGLVTGLAVAGFGFGAMFWVKIAGSWFGGLLHTSSLMGLPGVQSTFIIYGVVFAALVLAGSLVMQDPPSGWRPAGWSPPAPTAAGGQGAHEFSAREMLRTPAFYMLWLVFMGCALAGLMVIYSIALFGTDALRHRGIAEPAAITGTAMAWYAVLNGFGRIAWGWISDRIGRKPALVTMAVLQGLVVLMIYHVFITFGTVTGFITAAALIGFNFGANFALFPAITADYFGNRNVGANYGWLFTAYGVAGIVGPLLAAHFKDEALGTGHPVAWMTPFIVAGAACLIGAVVMALTHPPRAAVDPGPPPARG